MRKVLVSLFGFFLGACLLGDGGMGPGPGSPASTGGGSNPSVVQTAVGTYTNTSTTVTASFSTLPASADSVVVELVGYNVGATATGVADNQGNCSSAAYTKVQALQGASAQAVAEVWWCHAVGSSSGTFTVTATYAASVHARMTIIEVANISAVDKSGTMSPALGSTTNTPTVTASGANTNANDFVVSVMSFGFTGTNPTMSHPPTSSYTDLGFTQGWGTLYVDADIGYKVVTAIETSSGAWTSTGEPSGYDQAGIVASFH